MSIDRLERNQRALDTSDLLSTLTGRTVRGGAINMAAQIIALVMQIGSMALFARLLQPSDYGILAMAGTVIAFAALFTNMGLTTPTIQRSKITSDQVSTLFFISLAGGIGVAIVSCLSAPLFVDFFNNEATGNVLLLLSLTIPMAAAGSQFNAVLVRRMEWSKLQFINLFSQIAGITVGLLLAWKVGIGVYALVAQQLITGLVALISNVALCRWRPTLHFSLSGVRSELSMGMDMLFFGVFNFLHRQLDNIFIGVRWGPVDLGLYSRAYNVMTQANYGLIGPLGSVFVPSLSRVNHDLEKWKRYFLLASVVMVTCVGGIFSILFASSEEIVQILFGPKWQGVTPILQALLVAGLSNALHSPFSWVFPSLGYTRRQLYWSLMSAPFFIFAFWIGSIYGAASVAIAYAVTICIINFAYIYIAISKTPVSYRESLLIVMPIYVYFFIIVAFYFFGGFENQFSGNIYIRIISNSIIITLSFLIYVLLLSYILPIYKLSRISFHSNIIKYYNKIMNKDNNEFG